MQLFQIVSTIATAVSAGCACAAAVIAVIATRNTLRQIQHQKATSKSQSLLSCLDKYLVVMGRLYEGMCERRMEFAYDSMRSLADLIWFELLLWREGQIPDDAMAAWLAGRRRQYLSGKPDVKFKKNECSDSMMNYFKQYHGVVSYRNVWMYLEHTGYYEKSDEFLNFMRQVQESQVPIPTLLEGMRRKETSGSQNRLDSAATTQTVPAASGSSPSGMPHDGLRR
jgi:hypothetical protein